MGECRKARHRDISIPERGEPTMTKRQTEPGKRGAAVLLERYGGDFTAARARDGLLKRELAKIPNSERLTPEQIEAVRRQTMIRQAALMRQARAAKHAALLARVAELENEAQERTSNAAPEPLERPIEPVLPI